MNRKRLVYTIVPLLVLAVATFACIPAKAKPTVTIKAPPNGSQVAVGQVVEVLFVAEDAQAVMWVQMTVDDDVVATQQSPLAGGQTPFEGILRWTPSKIGTVDLVVTAHNAGDQDSDPVAVSISVVEAVAGVPTPTPILTPTATRPAGQPTATRPPSRPTPTATKPPGQPTPTPTATKPPGQPTPTLTKTPTKTPTRTPTKTPTKTPTQVPKPEIVAFISDKDVVYPGECVTFQWTTRNATEIYLETWPVAVPAGEKVICYDEMGVGDNWFRLTAVNSADSVFEDKLIRAEPPPETIISAPFVPGKSGTVSSDGRVIAFVSPGDDGGDTLYEGFMTFDIARLPGNATIQSAYLNLGPCSTRGNPATDLGSLNVVNLQYGDLNATDYQAGGAYIAVVDPCTVFSIDVTDRVAAMKAEVEFQVRLYFSGSDYDGDVDDVSYSSPTLDITYIIQ
jgi:hypothetical protein